MAILKRQPFLAVLIAATLLSMVGGCAGTKKPEAQKDLVKLSLDTQEEARKLRDAGNLESAAVKYQEALRYHTSPSLHQELGGVLADLNRYPEARKQFELALVENPTMREAEVALEQLDARIELAEADRLGPRKSDGSSPSEGAGIAGGSGREAATGERFEFMDEEAAFREMSEYTPAQASARPNTRSSQSRGGSDLSEDAQSIFGLGEDNLDLEFDDAPPISSDRGTGFEGFAAAPAFSSNSKDDTGQSIAPTRSALGGRKPLPGGRGLIQGRGLVSQVVTSGPPAKRGPDPGYDLENNLDFEGTNEGFYNVPENQTTVSVPRTTPISPRGGRGLGSDQRLPGVKQSEPITTPERRIGTYQPVMPTDNNRLDVAATAANEIEKNSNLPAKDSGFLGSDPIVYPEPKPKGPTTLGQTLPAPGFEKEVLDMSGTSFSDRFKGRRANSLDLETCKRRFYEEKDLEGAIRCFRDKRIDFPESSELHYELGKILETSGQYPMAREEYLLALRYSPDNQQYREALASVEVGQARQLIENGNYLAATEILIKTVDRFPDMAPAYRELAKAYSKSALSKEQDLAALGIDSPEVEGAINTEWRRAEASYRKLLDLSGGGFRDYYNFGVAIQSQYDPGKDRLAINAYERCLELNPTFWDAHYNVAILYESKNPQKALYHYEEALSIARSETGPEGTAHRIQCLGALGELYWRTGEPDKAADYLTDYMRLVPDDAHIEEILDQITSAPAIRN